MSPALAAALAELSRYIEHLDNVQPIGSIQTPIKLLLALKSAFETEQRNGGWRA